MSLNCDVKPRQVLRRLRRAGVEVDTKRGKGGHYLLTYRDRRTTLPVHGDTDLGPNFVRRICKQLGIDPNSVL